MPEQQEQKQEKPRFVRPTVITLEEAKAKPESDMNEYDFDGDDGKFCRHCRSEVGGQHGRAARTPCGRGGGSVFRPRRLREMVD